MRTTARSRPSTRWLPVALLALGAELVIARTGTTRSNPLPVEVRGA
jgi:hypothetical protein